MSDDIPSAQTTVDVKLDYMQRDIRDIKSDIKDIKTSSISREEFNKAIIDIHERIKPINNYAQDKARVWVAITVLVALGGAIITLSIMAINTKIKEGIENALGQYEIQVK